MLNPDLEITEHKAEIATDLYNHVTQTVEQFYMRKTPQLLLIWEEDKDEIEHDAFIFWNANPICGQRE